MKLNPLSPFAQGTLHPFRTYRRRGRSGEIYCGDALQFLWGLKPGMADIVFLDPPFNLGKKYSLDHPKLDAKGKSDYDLWLQNVLHASVRALAIGGTLYLYHIPAWAIRAAAYLAETLEFRHWIAIAMKNGFVHGQRLYPAHYALLMFTKGSPRHFQRPRLQPKKCRHCGCLVKDYGGYRHIIEDKGINLSDFWEDLSPVRHANRKFRAANELPEELFRRVLAISGSPGAHYVDPFAGSGTGAVMAAHFKMKFHVCDILESNCRIIADRLDMDALPKKQKGIS